MPDNQDPNKKTDENKNVRLEIRSRADAGFRREGRLWTQDPVEESFTEEAAQRLMNEPQLIVRRISGPAGSAGATGATGATAEGSPNISNLQPSGVLSGSSATDPTPAHPAGHQQPSRFPVEGEENKPDPSHAKRR